MGGSGRGPSICLGGVRKATKNLGITSLRAEI
jgi:hypothetical protein